MYICIYICKLIYIYEHKAFVNPRETYKVVLHRYMEKINTY